MLDTQTSPPENSAPPGTVVDGFLSLYSGQPNADSANETSAPQAKHVVPRRPLRLTPPRDGALPDARRPLAALNIFADVFDDDPAQMPTVIIDAVTTDARVAASRRRARRHLAITCGDAMPEPANFWHPDEPATLRAPFDATAPASNDAPMIPPPLHEHLARVRHALYDPTGQLDPQRFEPSVQMRLASHTMNATLIVVAFPVGAALTAYSLVRGSDIRVSAQAMAIVATLMGAWQSGLERLF